MTREKFEAVALENIAYAIRQYQGHKRTYSSVVDIIRNNLAMVERIIVTDDSK